MASLNPLVPTIFAAALLSIAGCGGTTLTINKNFPAASAWFEGAPGAIAVLPGDDVPLLSLSALDVRRGDTAAAAGTANTVASGCGSAPLSDCSGEVLATPLGTAGESEARTRWPESGSPWLREANEQLQHSLADRRPHLLVSHAVVSRIRARTAHDAQLKSFRGYPEEFVPEGPFNGLVEIGLTKFGLVLEGRLNENDKDPRVALTIGVKADVYSMRDREFVAESRGGWEYLGRSHRVSELTAENGRLLNDEIERAANSLAKEIVN